MNTSGHWYYATELILFGDYLFEHENDVFGLKGSLVAFELNF